jgi:hypothetical protein
MIKGKKIALLFVENINMGGIAAGTLDMVIEPLLDKLVARTDTPFDDALKASIYPKLSEEAKELASDGWDKLIEYLKKDEA